MGWITQVSCPDLAYYTVALSTKLGQVSVGDAKLVQRVLSKSKLEPLDIRFSNLGDLSKANLVTYCDASVEKLKGTDTVVEILSFVKGESRERLFECP